MRATWASWSPCVTKIFCSFFLRLLRSHMSPTQREILGYVFGSVSCVVSSNRRGRSCSRASPLNVPPMRMNWQRPSALDPGDYMLIPAFKCPLMRRSTFICSPVVMSATRSQGMSFITGPKFSIKARTIRMNCIGRSSILSAHPRSARSSECWISVVQSANAPLP